MATKGDHRRERILGAVTDLLAIHSFEEISIAEITRRAEVTRPGFYFYFPTKGAAVATLMEGLFGEFMEAATTWYEHEQADQREGLRKGMQATVDLWRKHAFVMHGMVQAAAVDHAARDIWGRWVSAFTARAVPTVAADLGRRTTGRRGVSPENLAGLLVDATFAAMQRDVAMIVETGEGLPDIVETIVHVWTQALYAPAAPSRHP